MKVLEILTTEFTGGAVGFSREVLLRTVGFVHKYITNSPFGQGDPFGKPPYGDDPRDQYWIIKGIEYFDSKYVK